MIPVEVGAAGDVAAGDVAAGDRDENPPETEAPPETERQERPRVSERVRMRAPRAPAVMIRVSGGISDKHSAWRQHGLHSHANWSSCWPPGMEFPVRSQGLSINATSSPEGTLTNLRVAGNNNYPTIATCLMGLMAGCTMGPADDGEPGEVRVGFRFDPVSR